MEGNSGTTSADLHGNAQPGEHRDRSPSITSPFGATPPRTSITRRPGHAPSTRRDLADVSVPIFGDTDVEPDEFFYFALDNPIGASLADDYYGLGTIGNDDSPGNSAPIAADDAYDLAEDSRSDRFGLGAWPTILTRGRPLQAFVVSGPAHGTLFSTPAAASTTRPTRITLVRTASRTASPTPGP